MCNGLPDFNNKLFWDEALSYYADSNAQPYADNDGIWEYFKFCLKTQNRFFFQNPLNPIIVDRYKKIYLNYLMKVKYIVHELMKMRNIPNNVGLPKNMMI